MKTSKSKSLLIKQVTVVDERSPYHNSVVDIHYKNGKIENIAKQLDEKVDETIDAAGACISPAWIDCFVDLANPGFEYRETLQSGVAAAMAGGFGTLLLTPNNQPSTTTAAEVQSIHRMVEHLPIQIKVIGAISKGIEGKELAEMQDMHHAGAVAFSDGWKPVQQDQLLLKALEYVKALQAPIIQVPIHNGLTAGGLMNEGINSVQIGMASMPAMSEEIMIHRDILLAQYTNSPIHITGVTTKKGIELIKKAKKDKIKVTCSVSPYHLLWTDDMLTSYNSLYKVNPPLRTAEDVKALVEGLTNGTIDCISAHHRPYSWDEKTKEFEYTKFGMAAIEVLWPMLLKAAPTVTMEQWAQLLYRNPNKIFLGQDIHIDKGAVGTFTLYDNHTNWQINATSKKSLAYNVPCMNTTLIGKARLIY